MAELEHRPVVHDHEEFLARARRRPGFQKAYDTLETEYQVANELIAAQPRAGMTQEAVAQRMGTTKSAVSRLESAGKHTPSVGTLQRSASDGEPTGCGTGRRDLLASPYCDVLVRCIGPLPSDGDRGPATDQHAQALS